MSSAVRGATTALLLDLVEDGGRRRLVESVPDGVLLTAADVRSAAGLIAGAAAVVLQRQTPGAAVRAALAAVRPDVREAARELLGARRGPARAVADRAAGRRPPVPPAVSRRAG